MLTYCDSSAAVVLLRPDEQGREPIVMAAMSEAADVVGTEWITPLEVTAAIHRRVSGPDRDAAERRWWAIWARMVPTVLDAALYDAALASSRKHQLRSLDAIHLAAALRVACVRIITFDRGLGRAAAAEGIDVVGG